MLLILLAVLFISSSQTYEQQSIVPTLQDWFPNKPLESLLSKIEVSYWGITVSVEERGYYYFLEFLLRKSAHFFIFGLIAVGIYIILPKFKARFFTTAFLTLLVAAGDEYRQSFNDGRTASFEDVRLDMAGALTALIIIYLVRKMLKKKRKKTLKE